MKKIGIGDIVEFDDCGKFIEGKIIAKDRGLFGGIVFIVAPSCASGEGHNVVRGYYYVGKSDPSLRAIKHVETQNQTTQKLIKKVITIIIILDIILAAVAGVVYAMTLAGVTVEAEADNAFVGPTPTTAPEPTATPTETPTPTTEPTPTAKTAKATVAASGGAGQYLGTFDISYYTCDPAENGGSNLTATGAVLSDVVGVCIAADPSVLPYGTRVYIDGIGDRVVMDCGGAIRGNKIDVLVASDADIPAYGRCAAEVYAR